MHYTPHSSRSRDYEKHFTPLSSSRSSASDQSFALTKVIDNESAENLEAEIIIVPWASIIMTLSLSLISITGSDE